MNTTTLKLISIGLSIGLSSCNLYAFDGIYTPIPPTPIQDEAGAAPQPYGISERPNADISTRGQVEDGIATVYKDGSKTINRFDGSTIRQNADGSQNIHRENGDLVDNQTDGSQIIRSLDGSSVTTYSNGDKVVLQSDGTSKRYNVDGSVIIKFPDGTMLRN